MIERLNDALSGRYRVERKLGEGGMATVWLAHDLKHDRNVAIKVLRPELAAVVGGDRFLGEIRTTANLQHPNILPLFDSGEADGFLYYVMPYVGEGETLRDRLEREKQLPVDDAVGLAVKVANALHAAHQQGVVHRDVKPANILLSRGEPLVADFGIALAVQEAGGGRLTETGLSLGTPYYMSPEQATGDERIGPPSDVYALGCVLYEMLAGEPPFGGATAQAVLGRIIAGALVTPRERRPSIPPNVDAAIRKSLEKVPADRFPDALTLARALGDPAFRHGETAEASAGTAGRWKALAALASLTTLGLLGLLAWRGGGAPPPEETVRFLFETPNEVTLHSGSGVGLDLAPDGSALAFIGGTEQGTQLWIREVDRLEPRPIPGTGGGRNPRFSPDGRSLAFTGAGRLTRVSIDGGPPLTLLTDSVPDGGGGLAWGDDGFLYVTRTDGHVWRVPEQGGPAERIGASEVAGQDWMWLDALPDRRGILFTRNLGPPGADSVAVLSLETGETTPLLQAPMARWVDGHLVWVDGDGTLFHAPFDLDRLEITGAPRPVLEGVQVNSGSAVQLAVSRSGTLAYRPGFGAGGGFPSWVESGREAKSLEALPPGDYMSPSVSPEGRRIAFAHVVEGGADPDIWVHDLDSGVLTRTTFRGKNCCPFWSPDGRDIGFLSTRGDAGRWSVWSRPADLGGEARLLRADPDGGDITFAEWTPEGDRLLWMAGDRVLLHGPPHPDSAATVFLEGRPLYDFAPSPDGRWLAYTSFESGAAHIYARPFPGPGGQRQITIEEGWAPRWSADGRTLVWQAGSLEGWLSARLDTDRELRVMGRSLYAPRGESLFGLGLSQGRRIFDVAPDGRILALNRSTGVGTDALVVVTGWLAEVRAEDGR